MDEYFYNDFDNFGESHHFSDIFLNQSEIQQKIRFQQQRLQNQLQNHQKQNDFPTNFTTTNCQHSQNSFLNCQQKQDAVKKEHKKIRKIRKIQISPKIEIRNQFTFSGSKNDTVQLNTNYKTLFVREIREGLNLKQESLMNSLEQFEKDVSSFKSFSRLYDSNIEIRDFLRGFIRSSLIIRKVIRNRAKFWMRLQMIKYIQALNLNVESREPVRWKSIRKEIK